MVQAAKTEKKTDFSHLICDINGCTPTETNVKENKFDFFNLKTKSGRLHSKCLVTYNRIGDKVLSLDFG